MFIQQEMWAFFFSGIFSVPHEVTSGFLQGSTLVTFLGVGTSATIWATMPALDDR
jgi:hypothetical protein